MKTNIILLASASSMLLTAPVQAETKLEPVIVTATRTAQSADDTISPVIVISREQIERQSGAAVEDIIRMYTGIEIARNGGPGQTATVFIRGAESNHTVVLIDGVRMNPGTIGGAAIQNIDTHMIERIEIVKGPRSTHYGSDAIGGVINIITKRQSEDGDRYRVSVSGGPYSTGSVHASADNKQGDKSAGINITATESDGFSPRTTSSTERGYDNVNLHMYGRKKMGETQLEVAHWQSQGNTEYLDFFLNAIDQDYVNTTTSITIENQPGDEWSSTVKLSRVTDEIDQNQSADYAHTSRYSIDWQNDVQLNNNNLLSSGLFYSDENTDALSFGTSFDEDTRVGAVFVQNIYNAKSHKLVTGLRHTDHETFGNETTWNFEYAYRFNDKFSVMLANNSGFRAPDSTDRFGFGGTPGLLPETSINNELGFRYSPARGHNITFDVYKNRITNLIEYDFGTSTSQNIGKAEITGNELAYEYTGNNWNLRVSGMVQNPLNTVSNATLLRRAKHAYSVSAGYKSTDFDISLDAYYSGQRTDFGSVTLDDYTLVNLSAQYRFSDSLNLNLRVENLTDETYFLASGFATPERGVYLELNYTLE